MVALCSSNVGSIVGFIFELLICGDAGIWVHICYGSYVRESLFEGILMCQQQCRVRALCTNDRAELSSVFKRKMHNMH